MSTSIITNNAALLAVQVLNATTTQLQSTQKQISTGYRVSDATDDGAAFAVAQRVRSDIGTLTTANQQLGNTTGLLSTTLSALTDVSNTLNSAKDVLLELANTQNATAATKSAYTAQYVSLIANVKSYIADANYNGTTLINNITGTSSRQTVVRNETGTTYGVTATGFSSYTTSLFGITTSITTTTAAAALATGGTFTTQQTGVGSALNTYGSAANYISNQVSYNNDKINALTSGLGALVDANLTNESAQLQALQVRQQLATQSLSIANNAPQSLLKLFQ